MLYCGVPRVSSDITKILEIEHRKFGDLAISEAAAQRIYSFCPELFCSIYDVNGSIVAYSTAFPMKPNYANFVINGALSESDITPEMMIRTDGPMAQSNTYVGSVVVEDDANPITRSVLLSGLLTWRMKQIENIGIKSLPVFMIAASQEGDKIIRFIGAKKINDGSKRQDLKAVYARRITPGFMNRASKTLDRCIKDSLLKMSYENCYFADQAA